MPIGASSFRFSGSASLVAGRAPDENKRALILPQRGRGTVAVATLFFVVGEERPFRQGRSCGGIVVDAHADGAGEDTVSQFNTLDLDARFDVLFHFSCFYLLVIHLVYFTIILRSPAM